MKEHFPGFYPFSHSEKISYLKDATIVLDSSVLLDLIKLNQAALFIKLLRSGDMADRLWIPYDVAWLYHHEMNSMILGQIERIKSSLSLLTQCKKTYEDASNYPFLKKDTFDKFISLVKDIELESRVQITNLTTSLYIDFNKVIFDNLFKNKIGNSYAESEMLKLYADGEKRFAERMPPGYIRRTNQIVNSRVSYHDYIIWEQMQKYAKNENKNVLFVTNNVSEDWFYLVNSEVVSPHQSLINEFKTNTNKNFYCISAYDFVNRISKTYSIEENLESLLEQLSVNVRSAIVESNMVSNI